MSNTQDTFNNLVTKSGKRIDPSSREALYEEFRAKKAIKDFEKRVRQFKQLIR
jgi:hypothetical protein